MTPLIAEDLLLLLLDDESGAAENAGDDAGDDAGGDVVEDAGDADEGDDGRH